VTDIYKLAVPPQKTFRLYCEGLLFKTNVPVYSGCSTETGMHCVGTMQSSWCQRWKI